MSGMSITCMEQGIESCNWWDGLDNANSYCEATIILSSSPVGTALLPDILEYSEFVLSSSRLIGV